MRLGEVVVVVEERRIKSLQAEDLLRIVSAMHRDGGWSHAQLRRTCELCVPYQAPGRLLSGRAGVIVPGVIHAAEESDVVRWAIVRLRPGGERYSIGGTDS